MSSKIQDFYQSATDTVRFFANHLKSAGGIDLEGSWKDEYYTGVAMVDHHHKMLFGLIQMIGDGRLDKDGLHKIVREMRVYTEYHFTHEEALFAKHGINDHTHAHDGFVGKVSRFEEQAEAGTLDGSELRTYIIDWFANHILATDMEGCKQILSGMSEEQKLLEKVRSKTPLTPSEVINQCFEVFDRSMTGTIDINEMRNMLKMLGVTGTDKEVQDFMKKIDLNDDGVIDMFEFSHFLHHDDFCEAAKSRITEFSKHVITAGDTDIKNVWKDEYATGVAMVDHHHKILFGLIQRIGDGNVDKKTLNSILAEMHAYVEYHFTHEEALFKKFGIEDHEHAHDSFVGKIGRFETRLEAGENVGTDIRDYLTDWFATHILATDMEGCKQILAQMTEEQKEEEAKKCATALTPSDLVHQCFQVFDHDMSGTVNVQKMGRMLKILGIRASDDEVKGFVFKCDTNGDGIVDLFEFSEMLGHPITPPQGKISHRTSQRKSKYGFISPFDAPSAPKLAQ